MRLALIITAVLIAVSGFSAAQAGCVLVRTATPTPGCFVYVGYANGVRVGLFHYNGKWVRSGSAAKCMLGGYSSVRIGPDAVMLDDGTRIRLDANCENGQVF